MAFQGRAAKWPLESLARAGSRFERCPRQCSGVFPAAQPLGLRSVKNSLYPAPDARSGFRLRLPDRFQHAQHVIRGDFINAQSQEPRRVIFQRSSPLRLMLRIAQRRDLRFQKLIHDVLKRRGPSRAFRRLAEGNRVLTGGDHRLVILRSLSRMA